MVRQRIDRNPGLTPEQRDFAEVNHNTLIYCMRSLRMTDDAYDIAALGYLAAVRSWFARPELHEYSFFTICRNAIKSQVRNERAREARCPDNVSLDAPLGDADSEFTLYDLIENPANEEGTVYTNISLQFLPFWGLLTVKQRQVINLYAAGFTYEQIARALGVKIATARSMVYEGRRRANEAERRRSATLKVKVEKQLGRKVDFDSFIFAEEKARRRLAAIQTRDDAECGDGKLLELIISILTEGGAGVVHHK